MFIRVLILSVLVLASLSVNAAKIDVNLNQDSARFTYYTLIGGSSFGRTEVSAGLLYNKKENFLLGVGLQVIDVAGSRTPGLEIGVGPKLYYFSSDKPAKTANKAAGVVVALGGDFRYKMSNVQRLAIRGSAYYAPSITSTMDADNYLEIGMRVSYELLPTADVYLGFRNISVNYTKGVGSHTLDSGVVAGMNMSF